MLATHPDTPSPAELAVARTRLLGMRVTPRWLARWRRETALIKADTGLSAEQFTTVVLDVLVASLPEIRARAIQRANTTT